MPAPAPPAAPARLSRPAVAVLGAALAYGGTLWLVLLHRAEGGHERQEPALLAHWLRDGTLALPGVALAAWAGAALAGRLVDRDGRLPARFGLALAATGAAAGAAWVLAAGSPLHALLFDAREGRDLAQPLHFARDALVALAATLPLALALVGAGARAAAPRRLRRAPPEPRRSARAAALGGRLTRRAFVGYGAAGLVGAGAAGTALTRAPRPARAATSTDRLELFINEGHVPMVDGSLVYMRGYGDAPSDDPSPSLTIGPTVFLRGAGGPLASRVYPAAGAEVPERGGPADAGVDPSGPGLHFIRRRHWASFFPRRTIVAETGSEIRLRIANRLGQPHDFTITGVVSETLAPGEVRDVTFAAPAAGTYLYHDSADAPVNRVLGLFGVLVVVPAESPWTFDGSEGEFERQWLWVMHDVDPEWGRRARMGASIDPVATPPHPRYFTLNDRSGVFSLAISPDEEGNRRTLEDTKPCGHGRTSHVEDFGDPAFGTGQLIRLVNAGVAVHQPHFHGNHVWTIAVDNRVLARSEATIDGDGHVRIQHFEDVVELDPMTTKAVMLPIKPPPDALEAVVRSQDCDWRFPMHCHAEMSQTAGGGLYPGGIVSDWTLKP